MPNAYSTHLALILLLLEGETCRGNLSAEVLLLLGSHTGVRTIRVTVTARLHCVYR